MKHLLRALQAVESFAEAGANPRQVTDRPRQIRGWKTVKELARELRFTESAPGNPEAACREWLRRNGVTTVRRGRLILVDQFDIERLLAKRAI